MSTGDILGIISIFVALIAIPITFLVGRRTRQLPDLRYCVDFDVVLKPNEKLLDQGLTMTVGDKPINSISRTRIAFWNQRGDTIRREDIVASDPLRIKFPDEGTPLQVRTLSSSREQTRLEAFTDPANHHLVDLDFDYLDAGDGAVFEIVQEGTARPELSGTIMGAKVRQVESTKLSPGELEKMAAKWWKSDRFRGSVSLMLWSALLLAILVASTLTAIHPAVGTGTLINTKDYNLRTLQGQQNFATAVRAEPQPIGRTGGLAGVVVCTVILLIIGYVLYRRLRRRVPRSIVALRYRSENQVGVQRQSAATEPGD
jgi:hypothetical protein